MINYYFSRSNFFIVVFKRMQILTTPWRDTQMSTQVNGVVRSESNQVRLASPETPVQPPSEV
jgi:hypothetical protein